MILGVESILLPDWILQTSKKRMSIDHSFMQREPDFGRFLQTYRPHNPKDLYSPEFILTWSHGTTLQKEYIWSHPISLLPCIPPRSLTQYWLPRPSLILLWILLGNAAQSPELLYLLYRCSGLTFTQSTNASSRKESNQKISFREISINKYMCGYRMVSNQSSGTEKGRSKESKHLRGRKTLSNIHRHVPTP